jgi:hypothetical protein
MAYRCIMGAWRHFWSDDRLHAFGRDKVRPIGPPLNDAAASGPPASAPIIIFSLDIVRHPRAGHAVADGHSGTDLQ